MTASTHPFTAYISEQALGVLEITMATMAHKFMISSLPYLFWKWLALNVALLWR